MSVWYVFCTIVALLVVDRLGRKPLLLLGTLGMTVGMAALGVLFHWHTTGMYVVLTMALVMGAYLVSVAPLTWLIMSEIFPNRLRGKAMGVASVCVWTASSLTTILLSADGRLVQDRIRHAGDGLLDLCGHLGRGISVLAGSSFPKPRAARSKKSARRGTKQPNTLNETENDSIGTHGGKSDRGHGRLRRHRPGRLPAILRRRRHGHHDRPQERRGRLGHRQGNPDGQRHDRVPPLRRRRSAVDRRDVPRGVAAPSAHRRRDRQRGDGGKRRRFSTFGPTSGRRIST